MQEKSSNDSYRTGYIGYKIPKSKHGGSLAHPVTENTRPRGKYYFVDNPILSRFWESGKLGAEQCHLYGRPVRDLRF